MPHVTVKAAHLQRTGLGWLRGKQLGQPQKAKRGSLQKRARQPSEGQHLPAHHQPAPGRRHHVQRSIRQGSQHREEGQNGDSSQGIESQPVPAIHPSAENALHPVLKGQAGQKAVHQGPRSKEARQNQYT